MPYTQNIVRGLRSVVLGVPVQQYLSRFLRSVLARVLLGVSVRMFVKSTVTNVSGMLRCLYGCFWVYVFGCYSCDLKFVREIGLQIDSKFRYQM